MVRLGPGRMGRADRLDDVLATTGVHVGGTDFDRRLSLELLMPLLGFRHLGPSGREVPSRVFFDLSTWHLIQWLYSPKALRDAQALRTDYADQRLHARLMTVLNERFGHKLANAMEQAKIAASVSHADAPIPLDWIEPALASCVTPEGLEQHLDGPLAQVVACAQQCLQRQVCRRQTCMRFISPGARRLYGLCATRCAKRFPTLPRLRGLIRGRGHGVGCGPLICYQKRSCLRLLDKR